MLTAILLIFFVGYLMIALEHPLKVNKAGTALLTGIVLWVLLPVQRQVFKHELYF